MDIIKDFIKIVIFLSVYFFLIKFFFKKEFSLIKISIKDFLCLRCGLCCRFLILLSKSDIKQIESLGHEYFSFVDKKYMFKFLKKKSSGFCCFYHYDELKNISTCQIYEKRPKTCRKFPFINLYFCQRADPRCKGVKCKQR